MCLYLHKRYGHNFTEPLQSPCTYSALGANAAAFTIFLEDLLPVVALIGLISTVGGAMMNERPRRYANFNARDIVRRVQCIR